MDTESPSPEAGPRQDGAAELRVVGLGASAGGIQALREFFAQMPADSGMAFVVILHLPPEHESNLVPVLGQATAMRVAQVTEPVRVAVNSVYVIAPTMHLLMNDGMILPRESDGPGARRAPIDLFFRSLAETHGHGAAAVVLSGSGADGTIGVQRIKEQGGVVMVQDPQEAQFDAMPRNAIATGLVDFILPAAAMPARLLDYWRTGTTIRLPDEKPPAAPDDDALREILALVRARTGHDFSQYKRPTVLRRIGRRMQVNDLIDLPAYLATLRARPEEMQALLRDLLISVTNFFRDPAAWAALGAIIPQLFAGKQDAGQVRAWVAACATGEEAYSVAMLLHEHGAGREQRPSIQVFATDIDEEAVAVARLGHYPETIVADVSPERLQRFFVPEQGRYRIKKEIRDMVLFAPHNLLRDPPFSKLDLITCRNLMIYLNHEIQEQVLQVFHFSLRPGGYLLLGASESTDGVPSLFAPIDKGQRLFQQRAIPNSVALQIPNLPLVGVPRRHAPQLRASQQAGAQTASFSELHTQLLAQYTPPSLIINEDHEIVYLSRGVGRFLRFVEGEPSHNLLLVVHPGLRLELRAALFAAVQQGRGVEVRRGQVELAGRQRLIDIFVQPIQAPEWAHGYILVVFNDLGEIDPIERSTTNDPEPVVHHLEEELQRTKDQLRTTIEQYETAVEEYKAGNEELQAINEELRAATEELETSKEELQSVNEELTTVNQELKHKVDEISQANNDLVNLMTSTEIGTIFVDRELRIKRYTPSAQALFNLIPSDINRPLAHTTHRLIYDRFSEDAAQVLKTLVKVEREIQSHDGRWYLVHLLPYRTIQDKIDGVILTFVDITARKQAEQAVRASEERLRLLIESVQDYAIFMLDPAGQVGSWNTGAEQVLGYTEAEAIGLDGALIFTPEDRANGVPEKEKQQALTEGRAVDERWHVRKDGTRFYASGVLSSIRDNTLRGFVKVMRDLTHQKQAEEELRRAHAELERRVEERTVELTLINERLQAEIADRIRAEMARGEVLRQLVTAQEEERRRIARELHDQLGQQLSALRLGLATLGEPTNTPLTPGALARLQQIAARLDEDVDRLALELRPSTIDDLGLLAALQQHVEEWSQHNRIAAELQASGLDHERLPPEVEVVLYRVVQEALTNILKHADARHVSIILERRADQVQVIVEDNGRGFDSEEAQPGTSGRRPLGLLGMQERAALVGGALTIESAPGRGTTLFVRIPLRPGGEEAHDA